MTAVDAIVGVLTVATAIGVVTVISLHWKVFHSPNRRDSGILPLHVLAVSVAHLCLMLCGAMAIWFPDFFWARVVEIVLFIGGTVFTLIALFLVGELQRQNMGSNQ